MPGKYIDEKEFCDFKQNFNTLVQTFNHSVTEIKEDVAVLKRKSESSEKFIGKIACSVAKIEGSIGVSNKVLWWILGIVSAVIAAGLIGSLIK